MSIDYSEKLLLIRKAEQLTQQNFAHLTNISLSTIKNYESGQQAARASTVESVIQTERFKKYALWLMTNSTAPESGQISPTLSPDGRENSKQNQLGRKIG